MKKLVLLGLTLTLFSLSSQAQFNININIGSEPAFVPVRYTTSSYYYAPARPAYVKRVVKVRPARHHYNNRKTYYVNRPVVYREVHYKNYKGKHHKHYYKGKGNKHRR